MTLSKNEFSPTEVGEVFLFYFVAEVSTLAVFDVAIIFKITPCKSKVKTSHTLTSDSLQWTFDSC